MVYRLSKPSSFLAKACIRNTHNTLSSQGHCRKHTSGTSSPLRSRSVRDVDVPSAAVACQDCRIILTMSHSLSDPLTPPPSLQIEVTVVSIIQRAASCWLLSDGRRGLWTSTRPLLVPSRPVAKIPLHPAFSCI